MWLSKIKNQNILGQILAKKNDFFTKKQMDIVSSRKKPISLNLWVFALTIRLVMGLKFQCVLLFPAFWKDHLSTEVPLLSEKQAL